MSKVMVVGAAGWLGGRLVARLRADGRDVIVVDLKTTAVTGSRIEAIEADVRDLGAYEDRLDECTAVFNCCGLQHPSSTRDIYAVNRDAPAELFKACMRRGVKTFVHISSIAAHGENPSSTVFIDEQTPLSPKTHYGKSKAQGDTLLQSFVSPVENHTRLIILRPGVFYAGQPSKNLRELLEKIKTSPMPIFSRHGFLRTYLDIEKAVDAMLLAEHHGVSGEAYLIGDIEPLSTLRFYAILADTLGVSPRIVRLPLVASRFAEKAALWAGMAGKHLRLPTIVGEFGRHTYATSAKAQRELGFVPHQSSEDHLRAMARMYSITP